MNMNKKVVLIFSLFLIIGCLICTFAYCYTLNIYKEALDYGYEHQYEEAIMLLEKLPKEYKNTDLHLWRFGYALHSGEQAFPINYEMEKEGWYDVNAEMTRSLFRGGFDWSIDDIRQDFKLPEEIE